MGIGLVYDRANETIYDALVAATAAQSGADISSLIVNDIFPSVLNKVGDVITRPDKASRRYDRLKMPLSRFGAITEYLMSNMTKAANAERLKTGDVIDDHTVVNPEIIARYVIKNIKANYGLTLNADAWDDAVQEGDLKGIASMLAISMQSLYDGIDHDHDSFIPALVGSLYKDSPASSKRELPVFTNTNLNEYSEEVFSVLAKGVRDMTQWRRKDFNIPGADMVDSKEDLILLSFDNPLGNGGTTALDVITARLTIGSLARASALGASLGVEVYEMPSPGVITTDVARAYGLPKLPGMQTADTGAGVPTYPYPKLRFALVGRGAINVGLKRLKADTSRSSRGHFDQTWVMPVLQLAYGAGQAIFFEDTPAVGGTSAKVASTSTK